jgi:hypothetical protein
MLKYLTRVETNIGYENYKLLIESEKSMDYNDGFYYIENAFMNEVKVSQSSSSDTFVPKQFYQKLVFPIHNTIFSEQKFEYGDDNKPNKG